MGWDQVEQAVGDLAKAVCESREYIRYQDIRAKVHEDLELEQKIHAYRKDTYRLQNTMDGAALLELADRMERESVEFRKNPLVNEYLDAELSFCRLVQHINWELVSKIDFDLGFELDD